MCSRTTRNGRIVLRSWKNNASITDKTSGWAVVVCSIYRCCTLCAQRTSRKLLLCDIGNVLLSCSLLHRIKTPLKLHCYFPAQILPKILNTAEMRYINFPFRKISETGNHGPVSILKCLRKIIEKLMKQLKGLSISWTHI